jgi:hypothetical protein
MGQKVVVVVIYIRRDFELGDRESQVGLMR